MKRVSRVDFYQLDQDKKPIFNKNGFLKLTGRLTRSGILNYTLSDGTIRREFRPPEEIKKLDSLQTFIATPVTDLHPPEEVTSKNANKYSVGYVKVVEATDDYVEGEFWITNDDVIQLVQQGKRKELSPGFTCIIEDTKGEYKGEPYDAIQRDIEYNHLAIGPSSWGRAGKDVAIRVDGDASGCFNKRDNYMAEKVKIDGVGYPIESAQEAYDRYVQKRDAEYTDLVKERDELNGKLDARDRELGTLQTQLKEATSQEKIDSMIAERVDLETKARKVLGDEADFKGKDLKAIRIEALDKLGIKLDDKASDAYISGAFEASILSERSTNFDKIVDGDKGRRDSYESDTEDKKRQEMHKRHEDAWKKPLAISRQKAS